MFYTRIVGPLRPAPAYENADGPNHRSPCPGWGKKGVSSPTRTTPCDERPLRQSFWLGGNRGIHRAMPAQQRWPRTGGPKLPAPSAIAFSERSIEIDGYLQRGQELEGQRRWGEALAHYEQGLRQYPDANSLEKRFELARLHYDLGRRYADRSFSERVSQIAGRRRPWALPAGAAEDPDALRRAARLEGPRRPRHGRPGNGACRTDLPGAEPAQRQQGRRRGLPPRAVAGACPADRRQPRRRPRLRRRGRQPGPAAAGTFADGRDPRIPVRRHEFASTPIRPSSRPIN